MEVIFRVILSDIHQEDFELACYQERSICRAFIAEHGRYHIVLPSIGMSQMAQKYLKMLESRKIIKMLPEPR